MATTVDTILVRIEADMGDLKRDLAKLQNQVDKSSAAMGAAFSRMGNLFKVGLAAVAVTQAARAGLALTKLASDVEEMQAKSSVVFGAFVNDVRTELGAFGDEVGRSRFELEGMAASIQDTFVPMGFARGEAAKLSVQLTKLAVDTASFNNAADTDVMAAFQSALVGNHETVRQFGIIITQAELDLELMRMGIEKGTKSATEAEKVQARLNLIMAGTTDAHGDAARTADSFANKSRALKAELTELGVRIGNELMPHMKDLVEIAIEGTRALATFLENMGLIEKTPLSLVETRLELKKTQAELKAFEEETENLADVEARLRQKLANNPKADEPLTFRSNKPIDKQVKELHNLRITINSLEADLIALETAQALSNTAQAASANTTSENNEENKEYNKTIDDLLQSRKLLTLEERGFTKAQIKAIVSAGLLNEALEQQSNILSADLSPELYQTLVIVNSLERRQKALKDSQDAAKRASTEYAAAVKNLKDIISDTNNPVSTLDAQILALQDHLSSSGPKIDGARQALEKLKDELYMQNPTIQIFQNGIESMADTLSDYLVNAVADGKANLKDLRKAFNQTLKQMVADAIAAEIIKPFIGDIFKTAGRNTGGKLGDFISSIGGKSTGGPVNRNQPYVVGERGPELFVPQAAGSVINAASTRSMSGGGVVVNQTFNVSTGVQQTVRNEIRSLMPQIADGAKAAVADAKRRGGSYGRAFA